MNFSLPYQQDLPASEFKKKGFKDGNGYKKWGIPVIEKKKFLNEPDPISVVHM
jgi:hypothetical protein